MSFQMNRLLHVLLGVVLAAATLVSFSISSPTRAATAPAAALNQTQICSSQGLPAGYVITASVANTFNCPGSFEYSWTIEPPYNNIGACFGSGYPAPYFVTSINTHSGNLQCAGFQGSMTLTLPAYNMSVCNISVFWEPWVIIANAQSASQCEGYGVVVIAQASEGMTICGNSPIPSGWTATSSGGIASQCSPYSAKVLHHVAAVAMDTNASVVRYVRSGDTAVPLTTEN